MVRDLCQSNEGVIKQLGFAYQMSDTPATNETRAPELGQHTNELLAELGISEQERERLKHVGHHASDQINN